MRHQAVPLVLLVFFCCTARAALSPCLDSYASRVGVTALPSSASNAYKNNFCQYTSIVTANGPIEIFGGSQLSSLQLYRARKILEFYLEDYPSQYGSNKNAVKNRMGQNGAKLDMPNGAHEQPGAGTSLEGQELYWSETPVEGDSWFMNNNMDHRDAAFEEILHLVHDTGIGIDRPGYPTGALPAYQSQIRAATNNAQPTYLNPPGNGIWAQNERDWVTELQNEGSLTQEYLASVIDVYYGLWAEYGQGMWGIYGPSTRAEMQSQDPQGYALVPKFFSPWLTWMVMLSPTLSTTFSMTFRSNVGYTWKSQYYLHATLLGSNNANLEGNAQDNCLAPNAGTNTITGLGGTDVVLFQGYCSEYSKSCSGGSCTVTDGSSNRDGTTHTRSVEILAFRDGDCNINSGACTGQVSSASIRCWSLLDGPIPSPVPQPTPPPTPVPTPPPTPVPTPPPTPNPTPPPSPAPTRPPTPSPTSNPTPGPTPSPVATVTPTPTPGPTPSPTPDPTPQPNPVPTSAPVSPPTTDSCADTDDTFYVDRVGTKDCTWLTLNVGSRFSYLCELLAVASACPSTCNACDVVAVA